MTKHTSAQRLTISTKPNIRTQTGFAYLAISQNDLQKMWNIVESQVSHVNTLLRNDRSNVRPLAIREQSHPEQPFHDLPPHLSLSMNSTPRELRQFINKVGNEPIELTFYVGAVKLVPPTMNGSLSVVMEIRFDEGTRERVEELRRVLKSEGRVHDWQHVTIGQSFYGVEVAEAIFRLNRDYRLNMARVGVEELMEVELEGVGEAKEIVDGQSRYFMEELLPMLRKRFEIGQFRGEDDHVVLYRS